MLGACNHRGPTARAAQLRQYKQYKNIFFCVGFVYSGEYDVCDVTLSVYCSILTLKSNYAK